MTKAIQKLNLKRTPYGLWESEFFNKIDIKLGNETVDFIFYYNGLNVCVQMREYEIELFDIETIQKLVKRQLASLVGDHFINKVLQIVS